ncbi:MAG: hypothetical protein H6Q41_2769 [Deltaproteobacteria bacterium]|jgi:hypothetical protein|nr:hypothetical protein [Deltaproteobacteria bacterium]
MNVTLEQPAEKLVFVRLLKNALPPARTGGTPRRQADAS